MISLFPLVARCSTDEEEDENLSVDFPPWWRSGRLGREATGDRERPHDQLVVRVSLL